MLRKLLRLVAELAVEEGLKCVYEDESATLARYVELTTTSSDGEGVRQIDKETMVETAKEWLAYNSKTASVKDRLSDDEQRVVMVEVRKIVDQEFKTAQSDDE